MALHIVTSKCFLTCEKVTFIKFEEFPSDDYSPAKVPKAKRGRPKKGAKPKVVKEIDYRITIGYYPLTSVNVNYNNCECTLEINVPDKQKATSLYGEIVKEVQEQHPSEAYLDKLVSKMLDSDEFLIEKEVTESVI